MTRFIQSDEDLAWHIAQLAEAHPVFAPLSAEAGSVPIRWLDGGFKGLVFVVTGQQISIAAWQGYLQPARSCLGRHHAGKARRGRR